MPTYVVKIQLDKETGYGRKLIKNTREISLGEITVPSQIKISCQPLK